MQDAFYLSYGGLPWGFEEIRRLTLRQRQAFIEALERQHEHERTQLAHGR